MAGRYQADSRLRPIGIQPAAGPTNDFVHPATPTQFVGDPALQQLANSLQSVQPTLTRFFVNQENRNDQDMAEKGKAMRAKSMLNYKEAVRQGLPLEKNPFFIKAWKEQDGSVAADKYNADLMLALAVGPFAASKDEEESSKLFDQFRTNWMKHNEVNTEDPSYVDSFNRKANNYDTNARAHQASEIGQRQIADVLNNTYHEAIGAYDDAEARQLPPTVLAEGLNQIADKLVAVGTPPQKINSILIDAAVTKALETDSLKPFEALNSVRTGSGFLGRTNEAKVKRDQIEDQINRDLEHADALAWQRREKDRAILEQSTASSIYGYISEQRRTGAPIKEEDVAAQIAALGSVDFHAAESMREVIKAANTHKWVDDNDTVYRLERLDLEKNLTIPEITRAFVDHKLTDETARLYSDRVEQRLEKDKEGWRTRMRDKKLMDISDDPSFVDMFADIKRIYGETFGVSLGPDKAASLNKALTLAKFAAQDYRNRNPETEILADKKKAVEIYNSVIFGTNKDISGAPVDVRKLTSDQLIPNNVIGNPSAFDKLTAPVASSIVERPAPTRMEWLAMKQEYNKALQNPEGLPEQTALGQFLLKHGIGPEDLEGSLAAMDSLYTDSAPRVPESKPQRQPTPMK